MEGTQAAEGLSYPTLSCLLLVPPPFPLVPTAALPRPGPVLQLSAHG